MVEKSNLEAHTISVTSSLPLAELHGERFPHFTETSFPRLFELQVSIRPDAIAIVCESEQLTFCELNLRANQLARHLQTLGIGRESIVGICIDRSVEMAVAIIATLKAGAAYLPLDPEYPKERLAFMLEDARPAVVLTKAGLKIDLPAETRALMLDEEWPTIAQSSEADLDCAPATDDLAYVIYTSGSTGNPKGVMITHGNLTNYLLALNHELQINADDLYLHTASIAFSSSRRQLLLPLSLIVLVVRIGECDPSNVVVWFGKQPQIVGPPIRRYQQIRIEAGTLGLQDDHRCRRFPSSVHGGR